MPTFHDAQEQVIVHSRMTSKELEHLQSSFNEWAFHPINNKFFTH
jgi:hypothetical protein